jgi:2-polyprenyl-3-methyl-5-hydroxy-6-metoxy-1,4-benzoquinol methylase
MIRAFSFLESLKMARGWFQVPNLRPEGDRSIQEQMLGLQRALDEVRAAHAAGTPLTVLDLGCAEGCISAEFAKAGAKEVVGIEVLESHLEVAREVCKDLPQVRFIRAHLAEYIAANPEPPLFDCVLALGIIHKLYDPKLPLVFAARSAKSLMCFRAPARATRGVVRSKFTANVVDVPLEMGKLGFVDEGIYEGVRGESVQYWRRQGS